MPLFRPVTPPFTGTSTFSQNGDERSPSWRAKLGPDEDEPGILLDQ